MNKDQVKGRYKEAKGKVKEVAGHVVGNKDVELEGIIQKNVGKAQAAVGDTKADLTKGHCLGRCAAVLRPGMSATRLPPSARWHLRPSATAPIRPDPRSLVVVRQGRATHSSPLTAPPRKCALAYRQDRARASFLNNIRRLAAWRISIRSKPLGVP